MRKLMAGLGAVAILAGCATTSGGTGEQAARSRTLTVCDVLRDFPSFVGRRVTVRGEIRTDYREYVALSDSRCPADYIEFARTQNEQPGCARIDELIGNIIYRPKVPVLATVVAVLQVRDDQTRKPELLVESCANVALQGTPMELDRSKH